MEKRKKKDKAEKKGEKVCEIFEIEKDGKEEIIKTCGIEEEKEPSKEQIKKEKNIFLGIIIIMCGFVIMFAVVYAAIHYSTHFSSRGVEFERIQQGGLMLYQTSLPVLYQGEIAQYNFYLREDPRKLEEIEMNGEIKIKENMVINTTGDFTCEGDGIIAVANLVNVYKVIGTNVIKDENATCDDLYGEYIWVNIIPGDQTKIVEFGLSGGCYNLYVNNCEILDGTEKFIVETLAKVNEKIN